MSSTEIGIKPSIEANPATEMKFSERLNDFMHKNRKIFLAIGIGVLALVILLGVFSVVSSSIKQKSTMSLELLEADYLAWNETEDSDRASSVAAIIEKADVLIKKYGKQYAAARALMIKAEILHASKDLAGAEKNYYELAISFPKLHMAPVALSNAAAVAEDLGDADAALEYLLKADSMYPGYPGAGRVALSIGRIYESTKKFDKAMETYTRLISAGIESDWTKIAQDRIILLKSQGLVE
jgi:tetratricopeptide (TPR) repeat protein